MKRRRISNLSRLILAALGVASVGTSSALAQAPADSTAVQAHDPSAIAFDQIDRMLVHGESPSPVGSFSSDAATISSLPPLKAEAPSKGKMVARGVGNMLVSSALGFIPFAGPFVAGAASQGMSMAQQAAERHFWEEHNAALWRFISAGTISHFAFYHGWLRSEQRNEITIVKPDEGLTFILNPAKKTVQVFDTRHGPETIEIDTNASLPPVLVGDPVTERLPDALVAGVQARGYRTMATVELKSAVGWCAPGRHVVTQVEYVTDIPDPQPPDTVSITQALSDGCEPVSTFSYREPGHLVLYRATSMDLGTPKGVTMMFERGNLKTLEASSVSLFSVSPDFKKEQ